MRRSWDDLFISIASEMATMSTCVRKHVGCVLVDSKHRIIGTGMNGVPNNWPHCDPESQTSRTYFDRGVEFTQEIKTELCSGANEPSGLSISLTSGKICLANHAESNALLRCQDVDVIDTCYTTVAPCLECIKKLLCTGATRIVYLEEYPGPSKELWTRRGERKWIKYEASITSTSV